MNKFLSYAGLVFTGITVSANIAFAQAPYPPSFRTLYDTDIQGGDFNSFDVQNHDSCAEACRQDPNCKAYTYVPINKQPPDYNNSIPRCWLKNVVLGKRYDRGMITGIKE